MTGFLRFDASIEGQRHWSRRSRAVPWSGVCRSLVVRCCRAYQRHARAP
jgi:hypothetical protein